MSVRLLSLHAPGHCWKREPGSPNIYSSSLFPVTASVLRRKIHGRGWTLRLTEVKFHFPSFWLELQLYEDARLQPALFVYPLNGDGYMVLRGKQEIPCGPEELVYTLLVLEHLAGV